MKYTIYTDGACKNNHSTSNNGGWGMVVYTATGEEIYSSYGGQLNTTNNQMELQGMIEALKFASKNNGKVKTIYSDSAYVVNGINSWLEGWKRKGWKNSKKEEVKNKHLWQEIDKLLPPFREYTIEKVKGHSGVIGNEVADDLANKGAKEIVSI